MHGAEHLHIALGVEPERARQAGGHNVDGQLGHVLGILIGDEEEVGQSPQDRRLARVDAVGVGHHSTLMGPPEDVREPHGLRLLGRECGVCFLVQPAEGHLQEPVKGSMAPVVS